MFTRRAPTYDGAQIRGRLGLRRGRQPADRPRHEEAFDGSVRDRPSRTGRGRLGGRRGSVPPASDGPAPTDPTGAVPLGPVTTGPATEPADAPPGPFLPPQWQRAGPGAPPRRPARRGDRPRARRRAGRPPGSRCGVRSCRRRTTHRSGGRSVAGGRRGPGWLWAVVAAVAALVGALIGGGIVAATSHDDNGATVKEISAGPALLNGTTNIETVIGKVLPGHRLDRRQVGRPGVPVDLRRRRPAASRRTRAPG